MVSGNHLSQNLLALGSFQLQVGLGTPHLPINSSISINFLSLFVGYEEFMKRAVQYSGIKINRMDPCFLNSETLSACVYVI